MNMTTRIVFLCVVALLLLVDVGGKMWGSRRKKEAIEEEEYEEAVDPLQAARAKLNKTVLSGNDFDQYISPEAIQNMMSMIPEEQRSSPEIEQFLNSPELQDPEVLKASMREGVSTMRMYVPQVVELLSGGPEALMQTMQALVPDLPAENVDMIISLLSGDSSKLQSMISTMPGIDESQREFFLNMLSGKADPTAALSSMFANVLGDSDKLEKSRLEILKNPELALAMGFTVEQLEDPEAFAALMKDGMDSLSGLMGDDGEGEGSEDEDNFGAGAGRGSQEELLKRFMASQAA
jgi:hypothetical protein